MAFGRPPVSRMRGANPATARPRAAALVAVRGRGAAEAGAQQLTALDAHRGLAGPAGTGGGGCVGVG